MSKTYKRRGTSYKDVHVSDQVEETYMNVARVNVRLPSVYKIF